MVLLLLLVLNFEKLQVICPNLDCVINILVLFLHLKNFLFLSFFKHLESTIVLFFKSLLLIFNLLFLIKDLLLSILFFLTMALFKSRIKAFPGLLVIFIYILLCVFFTNQLGVIFCKSILCYSLMVQPLNIFTFHIWISSG